MALLHGKSKNVSLKSQIETTKKKLEAFQSNYEKLEDKISESKIELKNSLADSHFSKENVRNAYNEANSLGEDDSRTAQQIAELGPTIKRSAVDDISEYIEAEKDEWDKGGMPWYLKDGDIENDAEEYFRNNGKIEERNFCEKYAQSSKKKDCKNSIKDLEKYYKRLSDISKLREAAEEQLESLETEQFDRDIGLSDEEDVEGNPLCFECLDELRELDKPTTGQVVGNILSVAAGGALSYFGYRAGKREGRALNELRMRQGYDPTGTGGMSWAGASLGLPFMANGIYGLAGGNSRFGNYACHPGAAGGATAQYGPFAHAHAGAYAGAYGPYAHAGLFPGAQAAIQFGGNPYGSGAYGPYAHAGAFPGAQAAIQFGGNPYGPGAYGPYAHAGAFPGAQAAIQFGGNPYGPGAYGPYAHAGLFPGAQAAIQFGGNPYGPRAYSPYAHAGAFPGAQAAIQFGGNPYGAVPGINAGAMYQQQQYAQYMQYQQIQMQAQMQAQQAWMQHQMSLQKDQVQRQQIIGSLTQELQNIQQQIYIVQSGGTIPGLSSYASLNTGLQVGRTIPGAGSGPTHSPAAPSTENNNSGISIIEGR